MDKEFIEDLASKYAESCEFKSNFPHDYRSVKDGYVEGFNVAERMITENSNNRLSQFEDDESWDDVISGFILKNNFSSDEEKLFNGLIKYLDKEYNNLFNTSLEKN